MKGVAAFMAVSAALTSSVLATPAQLQPRASATSTGSLPAVSVKGNAFWTSDGDRFYINGVDYQPGGSSGGTDPLADKDTCTRDVAKFKELGINTIRVYMVDNTKSHDDCMAALDDAGIYLALDVNTPNFSLRRDKPGPSYNAMYLQNIFATIDMFAKYSNTLLFYSGNEVINDDTTTGAAPYIKAVTRDMRSYIKARGYRSIPVGYSAADVESNRYETATYMNCGTDDVRSDFFAFNDYSWCDPSTFEKSGWSAKVEEYGNYSIPLFLSEYGCNKNPPREFNEVTTLFSDQMSGVYSGGLVYEYSNEPDNPNYGLVDINGDSVDELKDFGTLQKQIAAIQLPSGDGGYHDDNTPSDCPATGTSTWEVANNSLPVMPSEASQYFTQGAGDGQGLSTKTSSQDAGPDSHEWDSTGAASTTGSASSGAASSTGAAPNVHIPEFSIAPLVCGMVVVVSSLFGASLL